MNLAKEVVTWNRTLLEQLTISHPKFYGTLKFIIVFTESATCLYLQPINSHKIWGSHGGYCDVVGM
jgi:hypothetical protein